jgi:hypothetical protein
MASYDRKFEVIKPDLSMLYRDSIEVADTAILNPESTSPPALIDGEMMQINASGQLIRAANVTQLCFAAMEDRGDYGVQASRKVSILRIGGYVANTAVFNAGLTTLGAPVMNGDVTVGSLTRRGLVAWSTTPGDLIVGYVMKLAANNGGLLRFQQTLV